MKYSMVKQFSNNSVDNAYNFIFKWVDFGKTLVESFWAFVDIWVAFFLIFYNMIMYVYYLFLYAIDKGSESTPGYFRKTRFGVSSAPRVSITDGPNPIPAMYRTSATSVKSTAVKTATTTAKAAKAASAAAIKTKERASSAITKTTSAAVDVISMKPNIKGKGKTPIIKTVLEFLQDFFASLWNVIKMPFKFIAKLIEPKPKATDEDKQKKQKGISLIDEYMKEYERRRNK